MFKSIALTTVSLMLVLTTGCVDKKKSYSALTPPEQPQTINLPDCERELQALREVDNAKYTDLEKRFEQVMGGSASYANVRNVVNAGTKIPSIHSTISSRPKYALIFVKQCWRA